jgi:tetratricopeptide (TPR) repeat protein
MKQLAQKTSLCALLFCASFTLGTLAPETSFAQGEGSEDAKEAEFKARLSKGNEYYKDGDLEKALVEFEAAYALKPNPKLLFNIGLIYERLGNLKKAVDHYDRFVVAPDVPLELRGKASERLTVLRPIVEAQDAKAAEEARKNAEAAKKADEIEVADIDPEEGKKDGEGTEKKVTTTDPEKPESDGPGAGPVIGLTMLGLGVAAGATGGVMLATLDDEMAFVQESTPDARRDARERRSRNATIGIGLAAGGGALAVTGATIWLVSRKKGSEGAEKSAVLVPVIGPNGQMGLGFSRRF